MLIEGVLVASHLHPGKQQGAAAGDDIHLPLVSLKSFNGTAVDAGVDGHKVHTLFCVSTDDF